MTVDLKHSGGKIKNMLSFVSGAFGSVRRSLSPYWVTLAQLRFSGPLTALGLTAFFCLAVPDERFGPGHKSLVVVAPIYLWGIISLLLFLVGLYGLHTGNRRCWRVAHQYGVFLFVAIAIAFLVTFLSNPVGGPLVTAAFGALALNAWARGTGNHRDPFNNDGK